MAGCTANVGGPGKMCSLEWRGIQMGAYADVEPFTQARPGVLDAQVLPPGLTGRQARLRWYLVN
jgi:hypothetical protein